MSILTIENLCKSFGEHSIIKDLTFSVPENTIYGFLGQNGAGKTITMKMILGLLRPTSGKISVCDETVTFGETKTNRNIGYLPDVPEFYNFMKPIEYLSLCSEITGLDKSVVKARSLELLDLVGLDKANKRIGGFSRGMKQRLGFAQALLNEPRLLICDEPTSALDPIGRKEILDIMTSVKGRTTIVFSTHILSDVERICDHVAILHKGSVVLNGTLSQLKQNRRQDTVVLEFDSTGDLRDFTKNECMLTLLKNGKVLDRTITIKSQDIKKTVEQIYTTISASKIFPEKVEVLEPTLENLFMEVIK